MQKKPEIMMVLDKHNKTSVSQFENLEAEINTGLKNTIKESNGYRIGSSKERDFDSTQVSNNCI